MANTKTPYPIATPDVDSMTMWNNMLNNSFNKTQLLRVIDTLAPLFEEFEIFQTWMGHTECINNIYYSIKGKTAAKKSDLVGMLTRILADSSNRQLYFSTFPPELKEVWRCIDKNYYVSETQFNNIIGKSCTTSKSLSYYYGYDTDQSYIPETGWFTVSASGSWKRKESVFSLSPSLRRLLLPYFHKKVSPTTALTDNLPADKQYVIFNGENDIIGSLPILRNLFINDTLQIGKTKLPATVLKNVSRMVSLNEFFPHSLNKEDNDLRTRMALTLFTLYGTNTLMRSRESALSLSPQDMVRELMPHVMYYSHHLTHLILPMLSKVLTAFTQFSYVSQIIKEILGILTTLGEDSRWMSYELLEDRLREKEVNEMLCTFVKPKLMEENDITNTRSDKHVTHATIYTQVGRPYIQGVIFALASIGIVEIAYQPVEEDSPSPYDGLEYLRLTPLGRYALKITDTYTTTNSTESLKYFELSDDKLLIRALGDANPYESMLNDISNPIGNHRYVVTPASFLRNCHTPFNIAHKIETFRQFIEKKPPQIWEKLFDEMLDNVGKVTKSPEVYSVYEIDRTDLRLHEIISTDPTIRSISRRAENYILLVESGKYSVFRERLKSYGYLV